MGRRYMALADTSPLYGVEIGHHVCDLIKVGVAWMGVWPHQGGRGMDGCVAPAAFTQGPQPCILTATKALLRLRRCHCGMTLASPRLVKVFNSQACQLVLGAGAVKTAGLKSISAKHLALRQVRPCSLSSPTNLHRGQGSMQ